MTALVEVAMVRDNQQGIARQIQGRRDLGKPGINLPGGIQPRHAGAPTAVVAGVVDLVEVQQDEISGVSAEHGHGSVRALLVGGVGLFMDKVGDREGRWRYERHR